MTNNKKHESLSPNYSVSLTALKVIIRNLKKTYRENPILFFRKSVPDVKWPPKIREIFDDIYYEKVNRVIAKGPRGGGKSKLLSLIMFALWFFKNRNALDMGGSEAQAKKVYNYVLNYIDSDKRIAEYLKDPPTLSSTKTKDGAEICCVTSSTKQVRGPHVDVLGCDEVVEAKDELIEAALPMVDTSEYPVIIMTSTFHKIFGIFQDFWDGAKEKGYTRYSWDIFDIAKEFDPVVWEDKRLNREIPDLKKLKKLAKGRTGEKEGWVKIENIIQAWREKPTLDYFLIEYMGARPSKAGLVTDPEDIDACEVDNEIQYVEGTELSMGIDWGFSTMTSVVDFMEMEDGKKGLLENKNYSQVISDIIIEDIVEMCKERRHNVIYADSSGKFENAKLKKELKKHLSGIQYKCPEVIEVVFSKEKTELLGCYREHWEKHWFRIPKKKFKVAIWQYKRFRYREGTDKTVKKDDHIPDATLCALRKWLKAKGKFGKEKPVLDEEKPLTAGLTNRVF